MVDAVVGAVIMVAATLGLVLAVEVAEQAFNSAGRYPLTASERELLQAAGLADAERLRSLERYLKEEMPTQ